MILGLFVWSSPEEDCHLCDQGLDLTPTCVDMRNPVTEKMTVRMAHHAQILCTTRPGKIGITAQGPKTHSLPYRWRLQAYLSLAWHVFWENYEEAS